MATDHTHTPAELATLGACTHTRGNPMPDIRQLDNPTVTVSGTCHHCQGDRLVPNPVWDEFESWKRAWSLMHPTPPKEDGVAWAAHIVAEDRAEKAYWAERGYPDYQDWPDEMRACPTCNGTGILAQSWALEEFAQLLFSASRERKATSRRYY